MRVEPNDVHHSLVTDRENLPAQGRAPSLPGVRVPCITISTRIRSLWTVVLTAEALPRAARPPSYHASTCQRSWQGGLTDPGGPQRTSAASRPANAAMSAERKAVTTAAAISAIDSGASAMVYPFVFLDRKPSMTEWEPLERRERMLRRTAIPIGQAQTWLRRVGDEEAQKPTVPAARDRVILRGVSGGGDGLARAFRTDSSERFGGRILALEDDVMRSF
jgi:hypothetical protein